MAKKKIQQKEITKPDKEKGIIKQDVTNTIEHEMAVYSYNINLMRMFPDVCDGMKTVQRRIIYQMGEMGLFHNKPFYKVMTISGNVCAATHPHGSPSVDGALYRLGQDFSLNNPLITIHGNGGYLTGDAPAASRYTEGRLSEYGELFYKDIHKNMVDWRKTYDNRSEEPITLPAPVPNLLVNGSVGIGQGFSTSIPTHNLSEVVDLTIEFIDNPDIELKTLAKKIRPDFPTGGIITNSDALTKAYMDPKCDTTIIIRSNIEVTDKDDLLVKDIPYMQTTDKILDTIQERVNDKKIVGISDIVDSTNKANGVNILIKIKKGHDPRLVRNQLYEMTPLQSTFSINLMCTKNNEEFRFFNIKEILQEWLDYRRLNLKRMYNYDFSKLSREIHILDGLLIAMKNIDAIIKLIKESKDKQEIMDKLVKKYKLTKLQAENIAETKLYKLSSLDQKALKERHDELEIERNKLKKVLSSESNIDTIIKKQLLEIKNKFGKPRKTKLENIGKMSRDDLMSNDQFTFILTKNGFIKKLSVDVESQRRGTKGRMNTFKEGDYAVNSIIGNNRDNLLFFTNRGRVFTIKAYDIPESSLTKVGNDLSVYIRLLENEKIINMTALNNEGFNNENGFFLISTEMGRCKKVSTSLFGRMSEKTGIIACSLNEDDKILDVTYVDTTKDEKVMIFASNGNAATFKLEEIPEQQRTTMGVRCINLGKDDKVISVVVTSKDDEKNNAHIIVVTKNGYGKATAIKEFRTVTRSASIKGMMYIKLREKDEVCKVIKASSADTEIVLCSNKKIVKILTKDIKPLNRPTMGYTLMKIDGDDFLTTMYLTV